jgi:SpoIID/LytB domain protein
MHLHIVLRLFVFVFAISAIPFAVPAQIIEDEPEIEERTLLQRSEMGESHASGARDDLGPVILGNPTTAAVAIRVGLSYSFTSTGGYSEFTSRHHPFAEISHTAGIVTLIDRSTGSEIAVLDSPATVVRVTRSSSGYTVSVAGTEIGTFAGPIFFSPNDSTNQFKIEHIRRTPTFGPAQQIPFYRGGIELAHGSGTPANTLNVVNIVEIEDYVPGVVANESVASFQYEALKAQAVAARGYAIANIGRFRAEFPYDIVDSATSQVYRGVISEHPRAVVASRETVGLVGSYNGSIIEALYSSSMGGHTENNEWVFNFPSNQLPGANALPYLRGIYDGTGSIPDLTNPVTHASFWSSVQPQTYDGCVRTSLSRWKMNISAATIKTRLLSTAVPASARVIVEGNTTGTVTGVEARQLSGVSQRIVIARITLTSGVVDLVGWSHVRTVFGTRDIATPGICSTANVSLAGGITNPSLIQPYTNANGDFAGVFSYGGGFGHNVGMSQYGSQGRAVAGQSFLQILKAYYTGIDVGSYPIRIGREPGTGPPTLRQEFYAPNALGTLEIRNATVKGINIHINGTYDIIFREEQLADGSESLDLSPYLQQGLNVIQYNTVGRNGSATVNVNVE